MTKNSIALLNRLVIVPRGEEDNTRVAASLQAELMKIGFVLTDDAYKAACKAPREWLVAYHDEVIPFLVKKMGMDRFYKPFYVNFPTQVMEMSDVELFFNAFFHYLSDGRWEPPQELEQRGIAFEDVDFKPVKLGTENDFFGIFNRLASINQSLSENDKETLVWFLDNYKDSIVIPKKIPFKETKCIIAAKGIDVGLTMATDVLRVAVYMSGGDVSLPHVPKITIKEVKNTRMRWFYESIHNAQVAYRDTFKFKRFSREERRFILGLLEKTTLELPEMQEKLGRWLRLGERLHVGDYAKKFPRTFDAFQELRNQNKEGLMPSSRESCHVRHYGEKIRTFNSRIDMAFSQPFPAGLSRGLAVLSERPGEFARRLDWLVRTYQPSKVLEEFALVGNKVSGKVLFELYSHFEARAKPEATRSVMIKGKRAKIKELKPLPPLDKIVIKQVTQRVWSILGTKAAALPRMGTTWIDERLKLVPIPSGMRSVNTAIKTYVRGTRIPFRAEAKVIRAFMHWFDEGYGAKDDPYGGSGYAAERGKIDIDLSAGFYGEELNLVSQISYTNLKDESTNCCHSGDIRHRKGPCAEYVDIDIAGCQKRGIRYVVMEVHNFDGHPLHAVKEAVFGMMERENAVANEIFLPKTISNCMTLANESSTVFVCILDLKEKHYIWADLESTCGHLASFEGTQDKAAEIMRSLITGNVKMSVYDLLRLHAENRGQLTPSEAEAETKIKWEDFVTDYAKVATYMNL